MPTRWRRSLSIKSKKTTLLTSSPTCTTPCRTSIRKTPTAPTATMTANSQPTASPRAASDRFLKPDNHVLDVVEAEYFSSFLFSFIIQVDKITTFCPMMQIIWTNFFIMLAYFDYFPHMYKKKSQSLPESQPLKSPPHSAIMYNHGNRHSIFDICSINWSHSAYGTCALHTGLSYQQSNLLPVATCNTDSPFSSEF